MAELLYYVQDTRQYVGNCMLFWALDHKGYTCHLDQAHVFTEEEMRRICGRGGRGTDVPWPKELIDAAASLMVDHQLVRHTSPTVEELEREALAEGEALADG